jgi:UDP-N-acetylglucosamine 3-dehydrogenase
VSDGSARPLRAGVAGLGMMGRNHVRVWPTVPGVELVAVADPEPAALEHVTREASLRGYRDPAAMLAEESLDVVSVVAPTSLHLPIVLAALQAGTHVLVEKPIAATRDEAERMIAAARDAGRMLSVGHIERFNPAIRELRARLSAGELGRVFQVNATRLGPFPARIRDVGVVVDLAPHDLDIMRFLLGSDPVRVYAETEQRIHTEHEDMFVGVLKFANGAVGVLDINWLTPTKKRTVSVTGERGMYVVDYLSQDLVLYPNPVDASVAEGRAVAREVARREPLLVELEAFAAAVRAGGPPPVDPREAMVALLLARALVDAANRNVVISGAELEAVLALGSPWSDWGTSGCRWRSSTRRAGTRWSAATWMRASSRPSTAASRRTTTSPRSSIGSRSWSPPAACAPPPTTRRGCAAPMPWWSSCPWSWTRSAESTSARSTPPPGTWRAASNRGRWWSTRRRCRSAPRASASGQCSSRGAACGWTVTCSWPSRRSACWSAGSSSTCSAIPRSWAGPARRPADAPSPSTRRSSSRAPRSGP